MSITCIPSDGIPDLSTRWSSTVSHSGRPSPARGGAAVRGEGGGRLAADGRQRTRLSRTMVSARSPRSRALSAPLSALLCVLLLAPLASPAPLPSRHRRQLADHDALQPLQEGGADEGGAAQAREKRKLEGVTQAKFGIKNAVLGFVFGKINSLIDAKTRLVETLDRKNIEINKQYGIEPPSEGGLASLTGVIGQVIGPKLQLLGPKIQAVTGLLGGASGGGGGSAGGGGGLGSILSLVTSLSGSSSGGGGGGGTVETIDSSEEDDS